jgi:ATP:corrinoid adenosyltransferase
MKVLGIDTSTSCGSVGLIDDEWVISEYLLNIPVTHSERLLGTIELILTGRNAHPKVLEKADLVTEMVERKHYYKKGIRARKGIEL